MANIRNIQKQKIKQLSKGKIQDFENMSYENAEELIKKLEIENLNKAISNKPIKIESYKKRLIAMEEEYCDLDWWGDWANKDAPENPILKNKWYLHSENYCFNTASQEEDNYILLFDNDSIEMMIKNKPETLVTGKVKDLIQTTWADLESLNNTVEEYKKSYHLIIKVVKPSQERKAFIENVDTIIHDYNSGLKREGTLGS